VLRRCVRSRKTRECGGHGPLGDLTPKEERVRDCVVLLIKMMLEIIFASVTLMALRTSFKKVLKITDGLRSRRSVIVRRRAA
jgi:hypothetical protein